MTTTCHSCPPEFTYQGIFPTGRMCNRGYPNPNCKFNCIMHAHLQIGLQYVNHNCQYEEEHDTSHYICCCKFRASCNSDCQQQLPDLGPDPF